MNYICHVITPLGGMTLASDGTSLTGLWFDGQKYFGSTLTGPPTEKRLPVFEEAERWLRDYFSGKMPGALPPLALHGTVFQLAVWEILRTIPYGETVTYGEIAARLAAQQGRQHLSAQAVGNAVGHNPISILIPCHRVIGVNGSLTGYAGGMERKRALLELERQNREIRRSNTVAE